MFIKHAHNKLAVEASSGMQLAKSPLGKPISRIWELILSPLLNQVSGKVTPAKQQVMVQVPGSQQSTWGNQMEFLAPGFSMASPGYYKNQESEIADGRSPCISLQLALFLYLCINNCKRIYRLSFHIQKQPGNISNI